MPAGTDPARQIHDKFAPLTLLGGDRDCAAHHLYDVLRDGHAQTCTLDAAHRAGSLAGKRIENRLLKFLAHPDSGVFDAELINRHAFFCGFLFGHAQADRAAIRRKLDRIRQNIKQNLIQPQLIRHDIFVDDIRRIKHQILLSGIGVVLNDRLKIPDQFREMNLGLLERHFAALDPAHIQHIIDQGEQMTAGHIDFPEVVPDLLPVVNVRSRQGGEAHNGIHRRPHIVGHVVEESGLGLVCFFQADPGGFFFRHLFPGASAVTDQQVNDQRDDRQDHCDEGSNVIHNQIAEAVSIKRLCIPVGNILGVVTSDDIDAAV